MQGEVDVDGVGGRVGIDECVAALVQLVAVGEPHRTPHRRVQRPVGEQSATVEAQPQVCGLICATVDLAKLTRSARG